MSYFDPGKLRILINALMLACLLCVGCERRPVPKPASLADISKADADPKLHGQLIRTSALVTYSDPTWRLLFVTDQGTGMYIEPPAGAQLRTGDKVEIDGKTTSFGKGLEVTALRVLSRDHPMPPPLKVPVSEPLTNYQSQWVELHGVLRSATLRDGGIAIDLGCGDHDCPVHVYQGNLRDLPPIGSEVSLTGVVAAQFDSAGRLVGAQVFCPSVARIKVLKAASENPFSLPVTDARDVSQLSSGRLVHIVGHLQARAQGSTLQVGKVAYPVASPEPLREGAYKAEVVGFWNGRGFDEAVVRPMSEEAAPAASVRSLSELKHLTTEQTAANPRIQVRAVVTYSDPPWGLLFIQDETAAAFVNVHDLNVHVRPGDVVHVSGVASPGDFAPSITNPVVAFVRHGALPTPVSINLFQPNLDKVDSQWCTVKGIVHAAYNHDDHTTLKIGSGRTDAYIQFPTLIRGDELVDRDISVTGAFGILFNDRKQAVGHQIFAPSPSFVKVLQNGARAEAVKTVTSLQRYEPTLDEQHSVVLNGVVVLKNSPDIIFIQDQTGGIQVRGVGPLNVSDGDSVSVRGFSIAGEYSPVLEDAVVMKSSRGDIPEPTHIPAAAAMAGSYDSQYVAVHGVVNDIRTTTTGSILGLVSDGLRFEAVGPDVSALQSLRPGSIIEVRGICQLLVDHSPLSVQGFSVIFDSPSSINLIKAGPWWTAQRIRWVLLIIFAIALGVITWAVVLRRKVRSKTRELQKSLQLERNAQQFDKARNGVLETIAANEPLRVSMEKLAVAVQEQIENSVCAIFLSSDTAFDGAAAGTALIAPNLPEALQASLLSVLQTEQSNRAKPEEVAAVSASLERLVDSRSDVRNNFTRGRLEPILRGSGTVIGLLVVLFETPRVAELDSFESMVVASAARLVSIAHEHSDMHQRLLHDAYHDPLTGLPNRTLGEDRLEHALARAERLKHRFAVLCIDLDDFKKINDKLGHLAGDELLRAVSARFQSRIRKSDTIARVGGDEFMAILEECSKASVALAVAQCLVSALQEHFIVDGNKVTLSASIGVATYPLDGDTLTTLKRHADEAMYTAKGGGGNQICLWSRDGEAGRRRETETLLRHALEDQLFELRYQPIFDISGTVVAVEALLRLRTPQQELLPPGEFIDVAENSGLIVPIGEWVLRESCRQLSRWQGNRPVRLAINVSSRQFSMSNFADSVSEILAETGTHPGLLEIELTETVIMEDVAESTVQMNRLKRLGAQIAVDDFGTGYSSLNYLHTLPIDILKIDRSFCRTITEPGGSRVILDAIVEMARRFGIITVAEGIETNEQLRAVTEAGCNRIQGFLLATPRSAEEICELLQPKAQHTIPAPTPLSSTEYTDSGHSSRIPS